MATQTLMTCEQYADLPEQEGVSYELDEGRLIEMPQPNPLHGALQAHISRLIGNAIERMGADLIVLTHVGRPATS